MPPPERTGGAPRAVVCGVDGTATGLVWLCVALLGGLVAYMAYRCRR